MPKLSIILPTYNRAGFLPQAFESIRAQTFEDWELIVVDDGSTDDSRAVIERLTEGMPQTVRHHYQENNGPAGARNAGLELARADLVAFFDSDDYWLPHHLSDCVEALEANPDVDWVFCPIRRVDLATKAIIREHSFHPDGRPRPFLRLKTRAVGKLKIIEDPDTLYCAIRYEGCGGFQNSVVRRRVFAEMPIEPIRVGEDKITIIRAIARGMKIAYVDDVHLIIYCHDDNVSLAAPKPIDFQLTLGREFVTALEGLRRELDLNSKESRALVARIRDEYLWMIGYPLVQHGRHKEGLAMMWRGLKLAPFNVLYWKTFLVAVLRAAVSAMTNRRQSSLGSCSSKSSHTVD